MRDNFGVPPHPEIILDIMAEALECEKKGHSEALWNSAVHYQLLKHALRGLTINTANATATDGPALICSLDY